MLMVMQKQVLLTLPQRALILQMCEAWKISLDQQLYRAKLRRQEMAVMNISSDIQTIHSTIIAIRAGVAPDEAETEAEVVPTEQRRRLPDISEIKTHNIKDAEVVSPRVERDPFYNEDDLPF
jgi:hypothetical protein